MKTTTGIKLLFGGCISGLSYLVGGLDIFIEVLATFVLIDYVTGVLAALKEGKFDYKKGLWGIITKLCLFVIVILAVKLDMIATGYFTDLPIIRTAVIIPLIGNEGFSCVDNMERLGANVPEPLKSALVKAREYKEAAK
jgi:toxin secretion/phage lysis holin